jgi:hypothetical protein
MKNVFVILAVVAMAGCSHMPWRSSSGGMNSESGSSTSNYPSRAVEPTSTDQVAPTQTLP